MQPRLLFPDISYPIKNSKDLSLIPFRENFTTIFENFDLGELLRKLTKMKNDMGTVAVIHYRRKGRPLPVID